MKTNKKSEQGSALIVAMIFTILLALVTASYLDLALTNTKISNRTYHASSAMNVAETGLEEGILALNKYIAGDTSAFDSWTLDGNNVSKTFNNGFLLGQNTNGAVKVQVKSFNGVAGAPTLAAHAKLTLANGSPVEKWVEISLIKRSLFASGLVAKKTITFDGNNVEIDSWLSGVDGSIASAIPYNPSIRRDHGTIGSVLVGSTVAVGNGDVWGFASVGGSDVSAISVGNQGTIGPFGTPVGQKPNVSTDFSANIDPIAQPSGSSSLIITNSSQLPSPLSSDPKNPTIIIANSINLSNSSLTIDGYIRLILSAPPMTNAVNIGSGSGKLIIGSTDAAGNYIPGGVEIYTAGDIDVTGQGLGNIYTRSNTVTQTDNKGNTTTSTTTTEIPGTPLSLQIYGTGTSTTTPQKIAIKGNAMLSAVVYAPNADLTVGGGGNDTLDILGSFVCSTIKMNGHTKFHYDESLAKIGGSNPYRLNLWRELITNTERNEYQAALAME